MKAIIIEDEQSAADNLQFLLQSVAPDIQIIALIETVSEAIDFLKEQDEYDIIFMDIHLADGNSFEIVEEVEPATPIIFTTAYDQYAIKAFKLNSIDYLLKPIREIELKNAINKFRNKYTPPPLTAQQIKDFIDTIKAPKKVFKNSLLVQQKDSLIPIPSQDFTLFYIKHGVVRGITKDHQSYSINQKLEELEYELDPELFFRANRQYLIQRSAIKSLHPYFNGRMLIHIKYPSANEKIIVSKANVNKLKTWLQR